MFFFKKKKLDRFCILRGLVGNIVTRNLSVRNIGDFADFLTIFPGIDNQGRISYRGTDIRNFNEISAINSDFSIHNYNTHIHIGEGVHCLNSLLVSLFDFGSPFLSG